MGTIGPQAHRYWPPPALSPAPNSNIRWSLSLQILTDPTEPFYTSRAEIVEASVRGDRYFIYRVTDVNTAEPRITRWANPMRLVKSEQGLLLVANAQMELGLERSEEWVPIPSMRSENNLRSQQ